MKSILVYLLFLIPAFVAAQNDVLVLKKRGYHVRSYTVGDELTMETVYHQWFSGHITYMRSDTIFLNGMGFDYKEIKTIRRVHTNFGNTVLPAGMIAAGAGSFILGAVNGAYRHDRSSEWYTKTGVITASSLLVAGAAILAFTKTTKYRIGRKYKLDYLQLTFKRPPGSPNPASRPVDPPVLNNNPS